MRMLHCPFRSCLNASRRLEDGTRRSLTVVAALSCVSRIAARIRISDGNRRDFPVVKKRSVSDEANERITGGNINYLFIPVKAGLQDEGRMSGQSASTSTASITKEITSPLATSSIRVSIIFPAGVDAVMMGGGRLRG